MCESRILVDGKEAVKEAAKVEIKEGTIIVYDILGGVKEIENAEVVEIDFIGHTTKIVKK
ncbi:MAG: CooT family nickel-binding protein [Candidatus Altiarchaeota archaeon]